MCEDQISKRRARPFKCSTLNSEAKECMPVSTKEKEVEEKKKGKIKKVRNDEEASSIVLEEWRQPKKILMSNKNVLIPLINHIETNIMFLKK